MPTHNAKIFNTLIDLKYDQGDKDKLLDLINTLNIRINKFSELSGKVSDIKIIILTALAIEDELVEQKKISLLNKSLKTDIDSSNTKVEKLNSEIINLRDKLKILESEIEKKNREDSIREEQIDEVTHQLDILNKSILTIYDETN